MKTLIIVVLTLVLVPACITTTTQFRKGKESEIVDNLNVGIKSTNIGLRTGSANVLSDLISEKYLEKDDASKAMIPFEMLENGRTDEERIAAAVALYKLGNSIGIYRLRGVAIYDNNIQVSSICKNLYYTYHKLNGTEYLINF